MAQTKKDTVSTDAKPKRTRAPAKTKKSTAEVATTLHSGMGAIPHESGVAFRVWAPHAETVAVYGSFNNWDQVTHPLTSEGNGYWYGDINNAKIGDEYRYFLNTPWGELSRIDPYAREVTNSVGNGVVHDPHFDWQGDQFHCPPWNELVIYEMHVGTFHDPDPDNNLPAGFHDIIKQFDHLKHLGVNALQLMPVAEFAGDHSWGYNPAHIFAVETAYGGPKAFKEFVKQAHQNGFAVILDVVYNHFGPSDLDLWRFDGWSENDGGGIYFFQDDRRHTPWGATRPDYGRGEVRQFIRDNALMWLEDYHVDGLRMDMTVYIHKHGSGAGPIPEGWSLLQWINREIAEKFPGRITIAEDLQMDAYVTKEEHEGGAGFGAQWSSSFVHPIREAVIVAADEWRSMEAVAGAIQFRYNLDSFERVIYSESHDEVANGKARVPQEIDGGDAQGFYAQKRSTLAAALVFTSPGIPMLFQGQEFLEGEWFRDTVPVDWNHSQDFRGVVKLYRDLIHLRLNRDSHSRGLCGQHIHLSHCNDSQKIIAFRRWDTMGPGDDVLVIANFSSERRENYRVGFPGEGLWKLRLNSDWQGYSTAFTGTDGGDVHAHPDHYDNLPASAEVSVGPYSVLIFSQDR
jgi:1,4-alpha-glucan branching enzyme